MEEYIVGSDNIGRVNRGKVEGEIAKRRGWGVLLQCKTEKILKDKKCSLFIC
jgi:hypothetical protein